MENSLDFLSELSSFNTAGEAYPAAQATAGPRGRASGDVDSH